jgi:hypothetical protein
MRLIASNTNEQEAGTESTQALISAEPEIIVASDDSLMWSMRSYVDSSYYVQMRRGPDSLYQSGDSWQWACAGCWHGRSSVFSNSVQGSIRLSVAGGLRIAMAMVGGGLNCWIYVVSIFAELK